jgi:hypothetical protein
LKKRITPKCTCYQWWCFTNNVSNYRLGAKLSVINYPSDS